MYRLEARYFMNALQVVCNNNFWSICSSSFKEKWIPAFGNIKINDKVRQYNLYLINSSRNRSGGNIFWIKYRQSQCILLLVLNLSWGCQILGFICWICLWCLCATINLHVWMLLVSYNNISMDGVGDLTLGRNNRTRPHTNNYGILEIGLLDYFGNNYLTILLFWFLTNWFDLVTIWKWILRLNDGREWRLLRKRSAGLMRWRGIVIRKCLLYH